MTPIFHLLLLLLFLPLLTFSQFNGTTAQSRQLNITLNSSLSPTTTPTSWLSSSGRFAFGFYPQGNGFAVGVWLAESSGNKVIVWTANRDNPLVSSDARLLLTSDKGLVLQSGGQDTYISGAVETTSLASMLDSGNFVLYNSNSQILWGTFDSHTDTILGGQRLSAGNELLSSAFENNHSSGRFRMKMQKDGNLVLYPIHTTDTAENAYWASGTNGQGDNVTLHLDENGFLYLLNNTGFYISNLTEGFEPPIQRNMTNIYRATLEIGGNFRLYVHRFRGTNSLPTSTSAIWSLMSEPCEVKGFCGINSYCVPSVPQSKCLCPKNFDFVDPNQTFLGCEKKFIDECTGKNEGVKYDIYTISNTTWNYYPYETLPSMSEDDCRERCLLDCQCEAAYYSSGSCFKQRLPLRYWRRRKSDTSITAFVKFGFGNGNSGGDKKNPTNIKGDNKYKRKGTIIASTGAGIFFLTCFLVFMVLLKLPSDNSIFFWKKKTHETRNVEAFIQNNTSLLPTRYRYSELKKMTNSFKDNLGQGGYGSVFKGKLKDGPLVAVKVLNKSKGGNGEEFLNEVASISRTRHVNIVALLGFCFEGSKRVLVYEFMCNGSLDKFIYTEKQDTKKILDCQNLHDIALGIARGLEYLHRGCNTRILHLDIKPHNILLDDNFWPKISDFGLAKLCPGQESTISMLEARGTIGYIAPEVFCRNIGGVSHKSDVYGYGMMVLEMIGGRKNNDSRVHNTSEIYFPHWAYRHISLNGSQGLFGFRTDDEEEIARKMVLVGLWCIQTDPTNRPSMSKVLEMLEGSLGSLEMPPKPYLSSPWRSCSSTT